MEKITTVVSGTGKYDICKNEYGYWAIEHKYIGDDGCLKQKINGMQGLLQNTYEKAVEAAIFNGKVKEFRENNPGASNAELVNFMASVA